MNAHKGISLIILVTFLPMAMGCSTTRPVPMSDDPVDADARRDIAGYTDRDGVRHEWQGKVESAGADSLQFTRLGGDPLSYGPREMVTMRLAREDVASLELRQSDNLKTGVVVLLLFAVAVGGMILAVAAQDLSRGFGGND